MDDVRDQMPDVKHFVAFEGAEGGRDGWLDYEAAIAAAAAASCFSCSTLID